MTSAIRCCLAVMMFVGCATKRAIPDRPVRPEAATEEFVADTVTLAGGTRQVGRLYVGNGLLRDDSLKPDGRISMIVDSAANTSTAIVEKNATAIVFEKSSSRFRRGTWWHARQVPDSRYFAGMGPR